MPDDTKHPYEPYEPAPIPTYEEATSSRAPSQSRHGPSEISDDAERQTLLAPDVFGAPQSRRRNGYQAPSVQSVRSSMDSDELYNGDGGSSEEEDEDLRRAVEELEIMDLETGDERSRRRARMRSQLSKRIERVRSTLSAISFPRFRIPFPSCEGLTSRLPQVSEQYRPGWAILARLFGLFVIVSVVYALFAFEIFPPGGRGLTGAFNPAGVRAYVQSNVDESRIRDYLQHITSYDHMAGTKGDLYLAKWMEGLFWKAKMDTVHIQEYEVYLNYPTPEGRRVAIIEPPELGWEAKLEEEQVYPNPKPEQKQSLVFHGLSRAGNVTGPLVYVNYGSRADYKRLYDSGIDINGTIALVRYYGSQGDRALKVKAAEEWGVKGVLIYSDPADDGFLKGEPWPKGPWRPSDSVQRGAVSLMSWVIGDVLTPGWASTKDAKRISKDNNPGLVNIPSLPLAWRDAQKLLQALKGHGQESPEEWVGGVPEVEWWSGDLKSPVVHLKNEQDEVERAPIFNLMGTIEGAESKAKKIIVGSHRDSWCFGAADPGSGTAVMLEVANIFGELVAQGWQPLRSIVFASWDAEEYNLIGSTEYVEDNLPDLLKNGLAYLNVDVGVVGPNFSAAASPVYGPALLRVLDRVADPNRNASLRQLWEENHSKLEGLGAGSDYVAFQDMAGVSSIDIGFHGPDGGYPYHSCYETFEWMEQFGDPGFQYHKTLAQVWALLILDLAQEPLLPFDLRSYSAAIVEYVDELEKYSGRHGAPWKRDGEHFDLAPLYEAAHLFMNKANEFHKWEDSWRNMVMAHDGFESTMVSLQRMGHNHKLAAFEKDLLDLPDGDDDHGQHGVPGREQFKHVIFGPQLWSGYDEAYFPAIRDAIDAQKWGEAQKQLEKAARILTKASEKLSE